MSGRNTPQALATYLGVGDDSELSGSLRFTGQSTIGDFSSSTDGGTCRHPVANLTWDDLDQANSGVVLGTVVLPIFEISEERRDPAQWSVGWYLMGEKDEHWGPKLLNELFILGDSRSPRYTGPSGSLLVIERHIHIWVILELVKLVGSIVCDEK